MTDADANRDNIAALERALDALVSIRDEFAGEGDAAARWFHALTCAGVYANYRLHVRLDTLSLCASAWRARFERRQLAMTLIEVVAETGRELGRPWEAHVAALTDNPVLRDPLVELVKQFAAFRRVNDRRLRVMGKALGIDPEAKPREILPFDGDLDGDEVVALVIEVMVWLSQFGKASTLLISALRGEKMRRAQQPEPGTN
jgi:hypothetical protein